MAACLLSLALVTFRPQALLQLDNAQEARNHISCVLTQAPRAWSPHQKKQNAPHFRKVQAAHLVMLVAAAGEKIEAQASLLAPRCLPRALPP